MLRLHFDRGGEFSSGLLEDFYHEEGITQSLTLPASPQHNGIAERRIGLIIEPCVSQPETSPTVLCMGEVGDATTFRVWGSLALVRDPPAGKLSPLSIHYFFLGFPTYAPDWQFFTTQPRAAPCPPATSPLTIWFPTTYTRSPPPLCLAPSAEGGDPAAVNTAASRCPPHLETPPGFPPRPSSPPLQLVAVDSGAGPRGGDSGGAGSGGAGSGDDDSGGAGFGGAGSGGADSGGAGFGGSKGARSGGAGSEGARYVGADPEGVVSGGADRPSGGGVKGTTAGGSTGALQPLLRRPFFWEQQQTSLPLFGSVAGGSGGIGARVAGVSRAGGAGAEGAGGSGAGGVGAGGVGGSGAGGSAAGGSRAGGSRAGGDPGASTGGDGFGGTAQLLQRRPLFWEHLAWCFTSFYVCCWYYSSSTTSAS
ncbi:unnamed protein product [Closterium sp. NIES-53]